MGAGNLLPSALVDLLIEVDNDQIILVRRSGAQSNWALPGGYIETDEPLIQAATREAFNDTGLEVCPKGRLGSYTFLRLDQSALGLSTAIIANAERGTTTAWNYGQNEVRSFALSELPILAPAHQPIIEDYLAYRQQGIKPTQINVIQTAISGEKRQAA